VVEFQLPLPVVVMVAARTGVAIGPNVTKLKLSVSTTANKTLKIFFFIPKSHAL
jgi:hypothetical protein